MLPPDGRLLFLFLLRERDLEDLMSVDRAYYLIFSAIRSAPLAQGCSTGSAMFGCVLRRVAARLKQVRLENMSPHLGQAKNV